LFDDFAETKVSNFFKLAADVSATKSILGECEHCGGHLEFPAEAAGSDSACPHCGQSTALRVSSGGTATRAPVKTIVFIALAVVILAGGLVGAVVALKRAKRMAAQQKSGEPLVPKSGGHYPNPFADQQFFASSVTLETTPGTSMVRAVGTVKNLAQKRRFSVRIEIELLDSAGNKLESTKDYTPTLEPGATWPFKPLVLPKAAVAARVIAITEDR
jgi:hypothetical protein